MGVQDDINAMKESFNEIDKAILEGAKEFRTLQESISKTNSILASKNWVIFSRFISGTPLWRIQNRIKATVMLLNEMQLAAEKRRTEEAKELKNFSKLAKVSRKNLEVQEQLQKIKDLGKKTDKASLEERKKAILALRETSEIFDGLMFKLQDEEAALTKMTKTIKGQVDMAKKLKDQAAEQAELRKREEEGELAHLARVAKHKIFNNNITKSFSKVKEKIDKKGLATYLAGEKKKAKVGFMQKRELKKVGLDVSAIQDKDGNIKGPRRFMNKKGRPMIDAKGRRLSQKQYNTLLKISKTANKQRGFMRLSYDMMKRPFAAMGGFFKKVLINIVKMTFYAAAQFAKLILLVLVTLAAFKMIQPFLGNIQHALETALTVLLDGFALLGSGLGNIFSGVEMLFGLFTDFTWQKLGEALSTILLGFGQVLVGLLQVIFGTLLAAIGSFIADLFRDGVAKVGGGIKGIASGIVNVVKGVSGVVAGIALVVGTIGLLIGAAFALPVLIVAGIATLIYLLITRFEDSIVSGLTWLFNGVKALFDALPDGIADALKGIGGGVKKAFGKAKDFVGLSTGGRIKEGGTALVGEKGPELVTLPKGAQVHSNSASKAIASSVTNHITVQVTGRVGASDTEIRDIANKVAREINTRMNRTSTSVVKF